MGTLSGRGSAFNDSHNYFTVNLHNRVRSMNSTVFHSIKLAPRIWQVLSSYTNIYGLSSDIVMVSILDKYVFDSLNR